MIIDSTIFIEATDRKKFLQCPWTLNASCASCHDKLMRHLVTSLVSLAMFARRLPNDMNGEAILSIHKTGYPTDIDQSFLLIFRSCRIVTAVPKTESDCSRMQSALYDEYRSIHGDSSI